MKATDGLELFTRNWVGDKDPKAVIILVHGLGEHCGRYEHVAQYFTEHGFVFQALDIRGHGKSAGQRGHAVSYMQILDDVQSMIELAHHEYPGKKIFLYGHSMGGNIVLYYYYKKHPILGGIISTSPGLAPATPIPGWKLFLAKSLYNLAPKFSMNNGLDLSGISRDPEIIKMVNQDSLYHTMVSARLGMDIIQTGEELLANPPRFDIPLLLLQGSADRVTSPQATIQFSKLITGNVTFKLWDGFYHELHNEPEKMEVLGFIRSWIDQQII